MNWLNTKYMIRAGVLTMLLLFPSLLSACLLYTSRVKDIISLPAISSLISSIPMDGDNKVVSEHRILRHILVYLSLIHI